MPRNLYPATTPEIRKGPLVWGMQWAKHTNKGEKL